LHPPSPFASTLSTQTYLTIWTDQKNNRIRNKYFYYYLNFAIDWSGVYAYLPEMRGSEAEDV